MIETDKFNVLLVNDGKTHEVPFLKRLGDFSEETCKTVKDAKTGVEYPVLAALVDNKLKELDYRMVVAHEVEFIGYNHPDGRRTYLRSLCFVMQNAIRKVFPDKVLIVDHSLPSGLYCTVNEPELKEDGRRTALKIDTQALTRIKEEMHSLVERDLPFRKEKMACDKAERLFLANHQPDKAELLKSLGEFICSVYFLDGQIETFHGPLLPSTGYLKVFDIVPFAEGFCLQFPCTGDFDRVIPVKVAVQDRGYAGQIFGLVFGNQGKWYRNLEQRDKQWTGHKSDQYGGVASREELCGDCGPVFMHSVTG